MNNNWKVRNPHWGWPAPHHPSQPSCVRPAHPVRWLRLALSILLRLSFCILHFVFCSGWRVPSFGKHQFVDHYSHHNQCPHDDQQSSSNCKLFPRHPRDPWPGEYMRKCMEVYFQHVSYLEIIVIYDNYFVCLCWSLYQTPVRPLRLEWRDSGWWR